MASLYYAKQDFEQAFYYYEQVLGLVGNADEGRRARLGLMRCAKSLNNTPVVMQYAESLLQDEALPTDWKTEALLNAARSAYDLKDSANAKLYYTQVKAEIKGEAQAEATYHLAEFDHIMGKYEASNDLLFWMIENLPTYPKWRWNSLILMAKNYAGLRDDFQANYTLDFVIDNADFGEYAAQASAYKAELALQREREASNTIGVDSLIMDDFELESIEELEE